MFNSVARKGHAAPKWIGVAALLLVASHLVSRQITRTAERNSPPAGRFIEVDGVRLHYVEKGSGQPVVLLHGQGALMQDFTQTIFEPLAKRYRVIAFDRPGSGYSSRPSGVAWTPLRQAQLFRAALDKLQVRKPIVLGHSWGALAAMAYGIEFPRQSAGLILLSGFYFPRGRALLRFANFAVQPIIGPLICETILPPLFKLSEPLNWRAHFVPHKVPKEVANYPFDLTSRSAQIRTFALECGLLEPGAEDLACHYTNLELPTAILAGKGDHVLDSEAQSVRLHQCLPNSTLELLSDCGHMPHFTHPHEVLRAIDRVANASFSDQRMVPVQE